MGCFRREEKRLLVADSYLLSREALSELLSDEGYAVRTVAESQEAVSLVATWKPQLVLLDENLPGLDSARIAQLYTVAPDLDVILMTGEPPVDAAWVARQLGVHDYLMKPVNFIDLLALLSQRLNT